MTTVSVLDVYNAPSAVLPNAYCILGLLYCMYICLVCVYKENNIECMLTLPSY
jgi:hypothetical protein